MATKDTATIIVPAAICAALGMSLDATTDAVRRETKRLLDSPRAELIALASRDRVAFEAAVSSTAVVGYPSASQEFEAIVRARVRAAVKPPTATVETQTPITPDGVRAHNARIFAATEARTSATFASLQQAVTVEYPELAAEVEAERAGVNREYALRSAASSALAIAVEKYTASGKTWHDAIQI